MILVNGLKYLLKGVFSVANSILIMHWIVDTFVKTFVSGFRTSQKGRVFAQVYYFSNLRDWNNDQGFLNSIVDDYIYFMNVLPGREYYRSSDAVSLGLVYSLNNYIKVYEVRAFVEVAHGRN